jgi:zinc transporter, ZIP family
VDLLAYTLIPMAAMLAAAAAGVVFAPGAWLRGAVLHLAAGVIFAVVAVEFLPELTHADAALATVLGFAAGTALMLGIRALTRRAEGKADASAGTLPAGLLFATGVDLALDGLMLGIGFIAGVRQGRLLTVALAFELAALGLATVASLRSRGSGAGHALLVVSGLALLFGLCAVAGEEVLRGLDRDRFAALLAFGSAALLFLVTEELLTEAHELPESPLLTAAFFLGFIVIFLFQMMGG